MKLDLIACLGKLLNNHHLALVHCLVLGGAAGCNAGCRKPRYGTRGLPFAWLPAACLSGTLGGFSEGLHCEMRRMWRVLATCMMQAGCGVHAVVSGTTLPSRGARGDSVLLAAFARFGVSTAEKNAICHVVLLSQSSLPLCGNASYDLRYASPTRSDPSFRLS